MSQYEYDKDPIGRIQTGEFALPETWNSIFDQIEDNFDLIEESLGQSLYNDDLARNGGTIPEVGRILNSNDDLDEVIVPGQYRHNHDTQPLNTPMDDAGSLEVILTAPTGVNYVTQIWRQRGGTREFMRVKINGNWQSWRERPILGTEGDSVRNNNQNDERFRQRSENVQWNEIDNVPASATRSEISVANLTDPNSSTQGFITGRRMMEVFTWENLQNAPEFLRTGIRLNVGENLNNLTDSGVYHYIEGDQVTNGPSNESAHVIVLNFSANYTRQIWIARNNDSMYIRRRTNGNWQNWSEVITSENFSLSGTTLTIS